MKIVPSVLFLTFAVFLPNECDAMYRLNRVGKPALHPEESGEIVVTSHRDLKFKSDLMMDAERQTEPDYLYARPTENYERYRACLITFPDVLHKSSHLFSLPAFREGYIEPTYVPKSVDVMALDIKYYAVDANWHEYDRTNRPPNPESKEYARLYYDLKEEIFEKIYNSDSK